MNEVSGSVDLKQASPSPIFGRERSSDLCHFLPGQPVRASHGFAGYTGHGRGGAQRFCPGIAQGEGPRPSSGKGRGDFKSMRSQKRFGTSSRRLQTIRRKTSGGQISNCGEADFRRSARALNRQKSKVAAAKKSMKSDSSKESVNRLKEGLDSLSQQSSPEMRRLAKALQEEDPGQIATALDALAKKIGENPEAMKRMGDQLRK